MLNSSNKCNSFDDLIALKNDKEIGDKINKIITALAEENGLKSMIQELLTGRARLPFVSTDKAVNKAHKHG